MRKSVRACMLFQLVSGKYYYYFFFHSFWFGEWYYRKIKLLMMIIKQFQNFFLTIVY